MEQLVARWAHNPKVVSSSLAPATKKKENQVFGSPFFILGLWFFMCMFYILLLMTRFM